MLPMLTVTGAPGLLYLNGRLCGETGAAAMPIARDGVQYLELRPFDCATRGAVLRLHMENGLLTAGPAGNVYSVQWPNGWIALEIRADAPTDGGEAEPRLLAQVSMPGGQYLLVGEGDAIRFGRDAAESVTLPIQGAANASGAAIRPLPYPGLCAAEGACAAGRFAAVLRAEGEPEVVACGAGTSARIDAQGALHAVVPEDDIVGHAVASVFAPDAQGQYALISREAVWRDGAPRWPASRQETARAFLEAVRLGAADEAAGYLSRPEQANEIARRAGAFDAIVALPPDGADNPDIGVMRVDGPNSATVHRLTFTFTRRRTEQGEWKIDTVSEAT